MPSTKQMKMNFVEACHNTIVGGRDAWGNFKFLGTVSSFTGASYRIKIGKISWRAETKTASNVWIKVNGGYFSDVKAIDHMKAFYNRRTGK